MIDERKKELYNQLRNLFFEVIHKDRNSFLKMKAIYDSLLKEIFDKSKFDKNEEGFYWVEVRNDLEMYLNGAGNNLEEIGNKIKSLKRFFDENKNSDLKVKKKELLEEFEELYKVAKRGNRGEYDNLNRNCSEKITEIFGLSFKKGDEGYEWDLAKNMILGIFRAQVDDNKDLLEHYEKSLKKQKKLLRGYLK